MSILIGVVFATEAEAAPFLRRVGARPAEGDGRPVAAGDVTLHRFAAGGAGGLVAISGMGRSAAARCAADLIETHGATAIVNVGVCGRLRDAAPSDGLFSAETVVDGDALLAAGASKPVRASPWPGLARATLATVGEGLFSDARRRRLAASAEVVDMEGLGVAETCVERGIPCYLVKGATDAAGEGAREDLHRNLGPVSGRLAEAVAAEIGALAAPSGGLLARLHRLTRLEHALFSLPLLLAGAWLGADGSPSLRDLLLVLVAGTGARTFGMTMNRILDRDLDALNPRTWRREIPSGSISLPAAIGVAASGLVTYVAAAAALGPLCLLLSPAPVVPLGLYALLKRYTPFCHFGVGLCLALAPLGAFTATAGALPLRADIAALALFTFLWISGFDVIYALQDVESDRRTGVRSLPVAMGARGAIGVAAACHAVAAALLAGLWIGGGGGLGPGAALAAALAAFAAAYSERLPLPVRFFPLSAIASGAAALVVLLDGRTGARP